jgi:hypothetical protein
MPKHPTNDPAPADDSIGLGPVSRKRVQERAGELAVINGRPAHEATRADWDQARLELADDPGPGPKETALDAAPESERWDPVHGSTGTKVPVPAGADEDAEGRSTQEQLVDEGIAGAEHDQRLAAAKAANAADQDVK